MALQPSNAPSFAALLGGGSQAVPSGPAPGTPAAPVGPAQPPVAPVGRPSNSWMPARGTPASSFSSYSAALQPQGQPATQPPGAGQPPVPGPASAPASSSVPGAASGQPVTSPPAGGAASPLPGMGTTVPASAVQPMQLNRMPSEPEIDMLPPGVAVQTPYGILTKDEAGNASVELNPEGQAMYQRAMVTLRNRFTNLGIAGVPEPALEVGRANFDPIANSWL